MKAGDWVRFCPSVSTKENIGHGTKTVVEWNHGLLVEYHTWEKVARILYDGKIISVHASDVQLAHRNPENI